jgi:MFS family permease
MPSGRRLFLLALVVSLCVTGAIAIGTLLFAEFDDTAGRILATTALLAVASLFALPAGVLLDQGRARGLAWTVISASAAGFVVAMVVLWVYDVEWLWKLAFTLGLAAGAGAQAAATTSRVREDDGLRLRALYWVGIVLTGTAAVLGAIAGWAELEDAAGYYRVVGATAVAAVLATLLQPILRRMEVPADGRFELRITLDSAPSEEAVAAAVEALERHGSRVEKVVGPRV